MHEKIIKKFGYSILKNLEENGCKIIGDNKIKKFYKGKIQIAFYKDWSKEYLYSIVSVKSVKSLDEAYFTLISMEQCTLIVSLHKIKNLLINF